MSIWIVVLVIGAEFPAEVVHVVDGDTVRVKEKGKPPITVRFDAIDAPERGQPFADKATAFVTEACKGKQVTIRTAEKKDKYGRLIGEVLVDGKSLNRELVRNGLAWWFYQYSSDKSLGELEAEAKCKRLGIFSQEAPIVPRNWRRGARHKARVTSQVFIMALMPNPDGSDTDAETVILANRGNEPAQLDGWKLKDDDGRDQHDEQPLSGVIPPRGSLTIRVSNFQLGNDGDTVSLLHGSRTVHTVTYRNAQPGKFVMP